MVETISSFCKCNKPFAVYIPDPIHALFKEFLPNILDFKEIEEKIEGEIEAARAMAI